MLRTLTIRDFVIVDTIELEFSPGFSVFTGETGAGKSILIDALQLALGGRGDASVVREGANKADITADFAVTDAAAAWLDQHALAADEGGALLRRVIDNARALLQQGCLPLQVATQLGFADQSHLSRQFKKVYGVGPATSDFGAEHLLVRRRRRGGAAARGR